MTLLGKPINSLKRGRPAGTWPSDASIQRLLGWLAGLQTSVLHEEDLPAPEDTVGGTQDDYLSNPEEVPATVAVVIQPEDTIPSTSTIQPTDEQLRSAGLTGRCNKVADTCYTFWAGGSLALLQSLDLLNLTALRTYLLEKTQHRIGGFGKLPGEPPGECLALSLDLYVCPSGIKFSELIAKVDIMHSCLGLAGLAAMGEEGLKSFDAALCLSYGARQRLENLPWR
ncbi:MAG: hypothetical protein Q9222_000487 [Ikaeria aurantiellina]